MDAWITLTSSRAEVSAVADALLMAQALAGA